MTEVYLVLKWMPLDLTDGKSTLVKVMALCHQATSHYLSLCWPRSLSSYGVTRPQRVKVLTWCLKNHCTKCLINHPNTVFFPFIYVYFGETITKFPVYYSFVHRSNKFFRWPGFDSCCARLFFNHLFSPPNYIWNNNDCFWGNHLGA